MCTRKISRVHDDLNEIIMKIAETKNLANITYKVIFGFGDVDLFASGYYKVLIYGKTNGFNVKHKVIIKWHNNAHDRLLFREAYTREHVMFKYVTPLFLKIQQQLIRNKGLKYTFPNCILSSIENDKEFIAMYHSEGYKLFDRFQKINLEHATLTIKNLAKFHALSFVAAKIFPDEFEEIRQLLYEDVQYSDTRKISRSLICYFNASLSVIWEEKYKNELKSIAPRIAFILNKYSAPVSKYSVICHADCWYNNIFFRYQGGRPVDVLLMDYQLARFASPVTDISYFLFMCADYQFLFKNYDHLMDIYYGTCSAILRECNLDIKELYPKHIFQGNLIEHSIFGLVEALISMKIITAEAEEAQKMTEERKHSNEVHIDEYKLHNQDIFVDRVNGIVRFFFERNYSINEVGS